MEMPEICSYEAAECAVAVILKRAVDLVDADADDGVIKSSLAWYITTSQNSWIDGYDTS